MLGKVLILVDEEKDWLSQKMKETGLVDIAQVYRKITYAQKWLRTLHYHTSLPKTCWYGTWQHQVADYDTVILFDVFLDSDVAEYIEKAAPRARLIVFYRNPWYNNYYVKGEARKKCEIWSFDQDDCQKYGLKFNHQFYFYAAADQPVEAAYASDLFFVGKDKERLPLLRKMQDELTKAGVNVRMYVVGERKKYTPEEQAFLHKEHLSYPEVLKYNKNTNCLLELMQENQAGFTLRTVEAMFFNKKLVTNNPYLAQCSFYHPRNIYVLGRDPRSLTDFLLKEPAAAWDPQVVQSYSFEHWLKNFEKD